MARRVVVVIVSTICVLGMLYCLSACSQEESASTPTPTSPPTPPTPAVPRTPPTLPTPPEKPIAAPQDVPDAPSDSTAEKIDEENYLAAMAAEAGGTLIYRDDFANLANWDDYTGGEEKFEDGAVLLGTSRDGIALRKDVPADLLIELKARALRWREGTRGCGFRILLRMNDKVPGDGTRLAKHDFYDLQFHPSPDAPDWDGYRNILVLKQFAGKEENTSKLILQKHWPEGEPGHWYDVRVLIEGNTIAAWLDGEEVFSVTDEENTFPSGRFGLAGFTWGNYAYFKDLRISAINDGDDEE